MKQLTVIITVIFVLILAACSSHAEQESDTQPIYPQSIPTQTPLIVMDDTSTVNMMLELWSLPEVEISEFGRQVAEEFLSQFDSLFLPDGVYIWDAEYGPFYYSWGEDGIYDRYSNRIPDDAPFIKATGIGTFIAASFELYDLNYNGIPDIVIIYILDTHQISSLYRFIDGEYVAIGKAVQFRFFYDHHGRMVADTNYGFRYLDADGSMEHPHTFTNCHFPNLEEYGFNRIPSLADLEEAIRQSSRHRWNYDVSPTPSPTPRQLFATWQEAYTVLLREYMYTELVYIENGWYFLLHDINQDSIPELIIIMRYITSHASYRNVYTFTSGAVLQHEFVIIATDGGLFAPGYGRPWVVMFLAAGSGGWYIRFEVDGDMLIRTHEGMSYLSDEGHEAEMNDPYNFDCRNYRVFYMRDVIQGDGLKTTTVYEFEYLFGCHDMRKWLTAIPITEENIYEAIHGWRPEC